MTTNNATETTSATDDGRLKFQVNPQTRDGQWGFLLSAFSHHVSPPQYVMSEWISQGEWDALVDKAALPNGDPQEVK